MPGRLSLGERLLWTALAVAAAGAIGYGFNCLLDLVQHWAVFNSGIANLVS